MYRPKHKKREPEVWRKERQGDPSVLAGMPHQLM